MQYLVGQITFTGYRWNTQNTIEYVLEMLSVRYRHWQQQRLYVIQSKCLHTLTIENSITW